MAKLIVCVFAVCAVAMVLAAPQGPNPNDNIQVVRYINNNDGLGQYAYT